MKLRYTKNIVSDRALYFYWHNPFFVLLLTFNYYIMTSFLLRQVDRNGNLWVLSDRLPIFMYSQLDLQDYNFRILTGSTEELIMGTVCGSMSSSTYSTTTIYDHRDHMNHMDHMDHMNHIDHNDHMLSTKSRLGNSAVSVKTEIVTVMLLTCLSKVLV